MSVCHADRVEVLKRVAVAGRRLDFLYDQVERWKGTDAAGRCALMIPEAEAECLAAARALCQLADCSE